MVRSTPEWVGKSHDTQVPPRVRLRVLERFGFSCDECERRILTGDKWCCDHIKALINGGENNEGNLRPLCAWCTPKKDAADVAEKSLIYRKRAKHYGIKKKPGRGFQTNRGGRFKKKMDGSVVPR